MNETRNLYNQAIADLNQAREDYQIKNQTLNRLYEQRQQIKSRFAARAHAVEKYQEQYQATGQEPSIDIEPVEAIQKDRDRIEIKIPLIEKSVQNARKAMEKAEHQVENLSISMKRVKLEKVGSEILEKIGPELHEAWALANVSFNHLGVGSQVEFCDFLKRLWPNPPERPSRQEIETEKEKLFTRV